MKMNALISSLGLLVALGVTPAQAGVASAVSADDAHAAVSQGAYVLDVRSAAQFADGHLPQAVAMPADAAALSLAALARALSQAGIDSSRTMLVVGEAGDEKAQALWQRLAQVTSGRVLWLVGGVQEWQMRGYALGLHTVSRPHVPQFLTPFASPADAPSQGARMAGSKVRTSALLERNLPVQLAMY
jgi:rhodanese-related sulfurtransferase